MTLSQILKGSNFSLELFNPQYIEALDNRIIEKTNKKGSIDP